MKIPTSYEVSHWPEFVAFAKRLGTPGADVNDSFPWLSVTIQVGPEDETVKVVQVFRGTDKYYVDTDKNPTDIDQLTTLQVDND